MPVARKVESERPAQTERDPFKTLPRVECCYRAAFPKAAFPTRRFPSSSRKKKMLQRVPLEFFPNFSIFNGVGETTLEIAAQHRSYAARKGVFDYRLPRQFELLSILRRNEARYGESLKRAPSLNICGG